MRYVVMHPLGALVPVLEPGPDDEVVGFADLSEGQLRVWIDHVARELLERVNRS